MPLDWSLGPKEVPPLQVGSSLSEQSGSLVSGINRVCVCINSVCGMCVHLCLSEFVCVCGSRISGINYVSVRACVCMRVPCVCVYCVCGVCVCVHVYLCVCEHAHVCVRSPVSPGSS